MLPVKTISATRFFRVAGDELARPALTYASNPSGLVSNSHSGLIERAHPYG
jgi:hypothetical protein